eukprot:682147-Rhodomonas_salina.1
MGDSTTMGEAQRGKERSERWVRARHSAGNCYNVLAKEAEHIGQRAGRHVSTRSDHTPAGGEDGGTAEMGQGEVGGTAETGPGTMSRVHTGSTRSTCSILNHFTLHQRVTEWQRPQRVPRARAEKQHSG